LLGLQLVVVLGVVILACGIAARRSGVAAPVLLLVCGALLGFVPTLRAVRLPPAVMLLVFLPALLYWESLTTSLREIRRNLRLIALISTGLVISAAAVAHVLGLSWDRPGRSARRSRRHPPAGVRVLGVGCQLRARGCDQGQ
jgi:CPA1 family monovalent cation:H+ antiporter